MRRTKRTLLILGLALAGCRGPVVLPATITPQMMPVRILTTTATRPLLDELVAYYDAPGTLLAVNSMVANWKMIQARLETGEVPYALTTYVPPDASFWVAPVGYDGIVVIVHPATLVPALTLAELRLIMRGQITDWAAVGGAAGPVTVISREAGAATRLAFDTEVMAGYMPTHNARLALSSSGMVELVASTPGAVGYVSMGWLGGSVERVTMVPLAVEASVPAVLPSPATVGAGQYPLRTSIMIVGLTPPDPTSVYWQWFAWMQSDAGQSVVAHRYSALDSIISTDR